MDDSKKKPAPGNKPAPDEKWLARLSAAGSEAPTGVTTYIGLLRQSTRNESEYQLYQTLDMGSCLHIQKDDVLHIEELPADKSPFGSLGGAKVFVRLGAKIKQVKTATSTFEAGAGDDFDLDIRLGASPAATGTGGGGGNQTIPDTGCGDACATIPPFSDPDVGACKSAPQTFCGCTGKCTIDTCVCPPTGLPTCKCNPVTVLTNCAQTCVLTRCGTCETCHTNCGTCQTCATNCGTCQTCHTCATNCGTCRVNTCATKCGQETCIACTHINTRCPSPHCHTP